MNKGGLVPSAGLYPLSLLTTIRQALQLLEKQDVDVAEFLQAIIDKPAFRQLLVDDYNREFSASMLGIPENPKNLEQFVEYTMGTRIYDLEREEKRLNRFWKKAPEYLAERLEQLASANAEFEKSVEFFSDRGNFSKAFWHLDELSVSMVVAYLGLADGNQMTLEEVAVSHRVSVAHSRSTLENAWAVLRTNMHFLLDGHTAPPDVGQLPVQVLNLPTRVERQLKRAQIKTIVELIDKSETDMLNMAGFGQKSIVEITEKLAEHGLHLKR